MADIQQFTLTQLKNLLEEDENLLVGNYISQNLAIARNVHLSLVQRQFAERPLMLPEKRILIIKKGWADPVINLMPQHFVEGDLVFVASNGIVQFADAAPSVQGIGLSLTDNLFSLAIGSQMPKAFDGHLRYFHLHLEEDDFRFLDHLHQLLYLNTSAEGRSPKVTLHLLATYLWHIDHIWERTETKHRQTLTREQRVFVDFMQLVNQYATKQHRIDFYARQLCISPRYMSTIVARVSGRSAKLWIDEALATQIKIHLRYSDLSLAQLADNMNFPNTSFFCKFFKRMTGMTTQEYRYGEVNG